MNFALLPLVIEQWWTVGRKYVLQALSDLLKGCGAHESHFITSAEEVHISQYKVT